MLKKLVLFSERITGITALVAATSLISVVGVIMAEVVMRAFFTPLVGGIEIIRVSFLVAVFFAFAHVILMERDIRVDVLRGFLPSRIMRVLDTTATLISAIFFSFMTVFAYEDVHRAVVGDVYMEGRLLLPMWLPWGIIMFGSALAVLASLIKAMDYATRPSPGVKTDGVSARSRQIS